VLHRRRRGEERADDGPPLGEERAAAKADGVVLERFPPDHQQVALGRLDALDDAVAPVALGARDHALQAALEGGVEFGVPAGRDADVGDFENHG
jgi:hypothetical protein